MRGRMGGISVNVLLSRFIRAQFFGTLWSVALRLLCPWDSPDKNTGVSCHALLQGIPSEPPGKPKNTGVGSLTLLQGIFPTQELNQGLLSYRQILYQLSYLA